jgi:bacillithiol system protein YtxJ
MNWIVLNNVAQLDEIKEKSRTRPQVIFKHSTRCATSQLVRNRLERNKISPDIDFYFLDLIGYRKVSDKIAETFEVYHESPQVLLIKNGECIYDESHLSIDMNEILDQVSMN